VKRLVTIAALCAAAACSVAPAAGERWALELGSVFEQPEPASLHRALAAFVPLPRPAVRAERVVLPDVAVAPAPHPLEGVSSAELDRLVRDETASLGSIAIGRPNRGALVNGVQLPERPFWRIASARNSWGTRQTVESLERAVSRVHRAFPGTPVLYVGDISQERGGYLRPHRSHQSGLDVDVGYYYLSGPAWYVPAGPKNLDRPRTWELVKGLLAGGDVEYIFMSRSVQLLLLEHAMSAGEDPEWLETVFDAPRRHDATVIRHTWGHHNHLHVRFHDPVARETARRTYDRLVRFGKLWPAARSIRRP
jgi:murein endopeptidase